MYTHISSHLNSHQILCDNQHGFRQGRSCETQLFLIIDDLAKNLYNNLQTDVISSNFSKAFDKVSHSYLLQVLHNYGIRGSLQSWLENFLNSTCHCRRALQLYSQHIFRSSSGLCPGTFTIFMFHKNDLPVNISSKIKLYASNDVLLYSTISSPDNCH